MASRAGGTASGRGGGASLGGRTGRTSRPSAGLALDTLAGSAGADAAGSPRAERIATAVRVKQRQRVHLPRRPLRRAANRRTTFQGE